MKKKSENFRSQKKTIAFEFVGGNILNLTSSNQERMLQKRNWFVRWISSCGLYQKQIEMTNKIRLFKKQTEVRDILFDQANPVLELLIGGGAGGSKTFTGCLRLVTMCLNFPWTRRALWRSKMKTLKMTSLKTLTKLLKNDFWLIEWKQYKISGANDPQSPNTLKFWNWSEIILIDLKYYPSLDPDFDDLWSLELTGGFIDEAVQISHKAYQVFSSRIGRRKNNEYWLKPMLLMSCNPWKNWVYQDFYKPQKAWTIEKHKKFIQILATDNPYCPEWYIEKLSLMPDWPMKQRLYFGNWEYDDDTNKIYAFRDIQSIFTNPWQTGEKYIIADVAWTWNDDTIVTVRDWRKIIEYIIENKSTPETVKALMTRKQVEYSVKTSNMLYDWTWLWRGLRGLGCEIFQGASSPIEDKDSTEQEKEVLKKTYKNLRSQCFFMLAKWIKDWSLSIVCDDGDVKTRIVEELDVIQQRNIEKDWPLQIIPKEEIKKIIWHSPDFADVISMRVYFELIERNEPNFY